MLHRNLAVFDFLEVTKLFHLSHHGVTRDQSIQPLPSSTVLVEGPIRIQNVDRFAHRFFVASPTGVVVRVVRWRHLHAAGSQRFVSQQCIRHNRNQPTVNRDTNSFADQMSVSLVSRMNADSGIAEHRLGSSRAE